MISVTTNLRSLLESPTPLPVTSEELARFWDYVDKKYFEEDEGVWKDRKPYGTCTFVNSSPTLLLRKAGHSVQLFGGDETVMSKSGFAKHGYNGGHDWVLVDNRWVIDQWASSYLGISGSIHDLKDPKITKLYPPRNTWSELDVKPEHKAALEKWYKNAARDWAAFKKQDCA